MLQINTKKHNIVRNAFIATVTPFPTNKRLMMQNDGFIVNGMAITTQLSLSEIPSDFNSCVVNLISVSTSFNNETSIAFKKIAIQNGKQ